MAPVLRVAFWRALTWFSSNWIAPPPLDGLSVAVPLNVLAPLKRNLPAAVVLPPKLIADVLLPEMTEPNVTVPAFVTLLFTVSVLPFKAKSAPLKGEAGAPALLVRVRLSFSVTPPVKAGFPPLAVELIDFVPAFPS